MSILSTDSFVVIGGSHDICQDYAMTTDKSIIVCDGCSSSQDSDFGAQMLARSIALYSKSGIKKGYTDYIYDITCSIFLAHKASGIMGLPNNSLDATLVAGIIQENKLHFFFAGDGSVAWKYKGQDANYVTVQYCLGAPEYLSYSLDKARHDMYMEVYGNKRTIKCAGNIEEIDLPDVNKSPIYCINDIDTDDLEWAVVFSDGVESFQGVPSSMVMHGLSSFKNFKGKFMKRRAKRFFSDNKTYHDDDVACAAFSFINE